MILFLGSGFIGNALSQSLNNERVPHRIVSRSVENDPPNKIRMDINSLCENSESIKDINTVVYFAYSSVPYTSMKDIGKDAEENILNAIKLFDIFAKKEIRVIYISSGGSIYGSQDGAATEQSLPSPISAYSVSKYAVENYLRLFHYNYGLEYDILRLSNIYGVGQKTLKPQGVVSALAEAFVDQKTFKIWGDGEATKDYLYIDDLNEALRLVLLREASNDIYNVASGVSISLLNIISIFEETLGASIDVEKQEPFLFDVRNVLIDNSKFARDYSWEPKTDIQMGIVKTINWYKARNTENK